MAVSNSAALTGLANGRTDRKTEPIFIGATQTRHPSGKTLTAEPDEFQCKLLTSDLDGRLAVVLADHKPYYGPPLHIHRESHEWIFVKEGNFIAEVDGKVYRLQKGDSLLMPAQIPHRYINGPTPGTLLASIAPGDRLEVFFEQITERRREHRELTHEEDVAFWASFNLDLIGGGLTADDYNKATAPSAG